MARAKDGIVMLLIAAALGGGWLAIHYAFTPAIALFFIVSALIFWVSGARMIVTRRARVPDDSQDINPRMELHSGFSAQLWGVLYLCFGVIALGIAYLIGRPTGARDFENMVTRVPALGGILLMAIGTMIMIWALTRVFAQKGTWSETRLTVADKWLQVGSGLITGSLLLTLGTLKVFAPEVLSAIRERLPYVVRNILEALSR